MPDRGFAASGYFIYFSFIRYFERRFFMTKSKLRNYTPYFLILPVVVFMLALYAYPIFLVFVESFHKTSIIAGSSEFVGLDNFRKIISDGSFSTTLGLTFKYTALTVFLKMFLGFVMALFLYSDIYFKKTLRFLSLIPWAIPQVAVSIVWKWILDGNYGYLNYYLIKFGIIEKNIAWLSSQKLAFFCAAFVDTWLGISLVSMIFLAALNSIDKSLYESSMMDGANVFQRFLYVTVPGVKTVFLITLTLVTIWTFNSFNVIFVLTQGGPMRSTETLIIRIYQEAFSKFDLGTSSALSVVVFLILIAFSAIYFKLISNASKE